MSITTDVDIRPYEDEDEDDVLTLLRSTLGEGPTSTRTASFFRWKHLENPFGRSFMLVAESDGAIVGFRAFMRWSFSCAGERISEVRAVDTATHPEHQGRGIFSRLTRASFDELQRDTQLIFNTPNEKSLPGYLKMGWRVVGTIPILVRPHHPLRVALSTFANERLRHAEQPPVRAVPAESVLSEVDPIFRYLPSGSRLRTERDMRYLRWRYGPGSGLDYRAVTLGDDPSGGLAIFRVRRRGALREATMSELFVHEGDRHGVRRLIDSVVRSSDVDHVACAFPDVDLSARTMIRARVVKAPGGVTFVARELTPLPMTVRSLRSWALTLGDIEVF